MGKPIKFSISFPGNEQRIFFPGQTLNGFVNINNNSPMKMRGMISELTSNICTLSIVNLCVVFVVSVIMLFIVIDTELLVANILEIKTSNLMHLFK